MAHGGTNGGVEGQPCQPHVTFDEASDELRLDVEETDHELATILICRRLYVSHFLSTWNYRGFEFGSVLFLASIFPGTLLPLSIYALVRAASAIIFAPLVGRQIDQGQRLCIIRNSILLQRVSVVFSCLIFYCLLVYPRVPIWLVRGLFGTAVIFGTTEKNGAIMNTVAIERDWTVVMARRNARLLSNINAVMRRIDLICKLVSPLTTGLLVGYSTRIAILVTLVINLGSVGIEYLLIARVYDAIPDLAVRMDTLTVPSSQSDLRPPPRSSSPLHTLRLFLDNAKIYVLQHAFLPSLTLSMLYLTVLSFAGQMVTYLLSVGYTPVDVSLLRVVSTVFELTATFAAPLVMTKIGAVRTGLWSLNFQTICLGIAILLFWTIETPKYSAMSLIIGTILSRVGLWGFDLSAQVLIQEEVEAPYRGAFSTTEAALQNAFELIAYLSTIIFYRPDQFHIPATLSAAFVMAATALYASFVRGRRGHLLHASKCWKGRDAHRGDYRQLNPLNSGSGT